MAKDMTLPKATDTKKTQADFKNIDFSNTDPVTKDVFVAPNKKRIVIDDIIIAGLNRNANPIVVAVQVLKGGNWQTIIAAGTPNIGLFSMAHSFNGEIILDAGNGTVPVIRVARTGTSTTWQASITAVGHIKE